MRTQILTLCLVIAGCSSQEAGQSTYIDQPFVADAAQAGIVQQRQAEADRILAATLADQDERRRLAATATQVQIGENPTVLTSSTGYEIAPAATPQGNDDRLVASLEAAIASAGNGDEATMPSAIPAETDLAGLPARPAAPAAPVVLREGSVPTEGDGAAADQSNITDNSFTTVTQRETIESDAQRLANLSQKRVQLEAEPLPSATTSANLAAFARSTQHRIGQRVYPRGASSRNTSKAARTCRSYGNPDEAQRAFLAAGGPDKDKLNLDPDGDGFVCGWSPEPYRSLTVGQG